MLEILRVHIGCDSEVKCSVIKTFVKSMKVMPGERNPAISEEVALEVTIRYIKKENAVLNGSYNGPSQM
jgi:hypothetical protein